MKTEQTGAVAAYTYEPAPVSYMDLVETLQSIADNLENRAMSKEQEAAFQRNPQAESWRVYLSGLIIQARNEARAILAKAGLPDRAAIAKATGGQP